MVSKMQNESTIKLLQKQINQIDEVKNLNFKSAHFKKWKRDTEIVIEKAFGNDTRHIQDFSEITYCLRYFGNEQDMKVKEKEKFEEGLEIARAILQSMVDEIEDFSEDPIRISKAPTKNRLIQIFNKFHSVARQLRDRHDKRPTLEVEDEYDVQNLLHAILRIDFEDIRPEEWTPNCAGKSSRMDFLLKEEQAIIEVKKTRKNLTEKEIGDQLIVDIKRYQSHQDCSELYCFIYDPEERIGNPVAVENDLSTESPFPVHVFVRPNLCH